MFLLHALSNKTLRLKFKKKCLRSFSGCIESLVCLLLLSNVDTRFRVGAQVKNDSKGLGTVFSINSDSTLNVVYELVKQRLLCFRLFLQLKVQMKNKQMQVGSFSNVVQKLGSEYKVWWRHTIELFPWRLRRHNTLWTSVFCPAGT